MRPILIIFNVFLRSEKDIFLSSENLMISGFDFLGFEWTHVSKRELAENLITRIEEQLKGDTLEGQRLQECVQMVSMS